MNGLQLMDDDENEYTHVTVTKDYAAPEDESFVKLHLGYSKAEVQAKDEAVSFVNDRELRQAGIMETGPFRNDIEAGRTTIVSFYDDEIVDEVIEQFADDVGFRADDRVGDGGLIIVDDNVFESIQDIDRFKEDMAHSQPLESAFKEPEYDAPDLEADRSDEPTNISPSL